MTYQMLGDSDVGDIIASIVGSVTTAGSSIYRGYSDQEIARMQADTAETLAKYSSGGGQAGGSTQQNLTPWLIGGGAVVLLVGAGLILSTRR